MLPTLSSGLVYDMLDAVHGSLANLGHGATPIYVVAPSAEQSLAYSNILGEWLTKHLQDKTLLPEWPFAHSELARKGRITVLGSLAELADTGLRTPSVVFAGHPSLRCGDVVHILAQFGQSTRNSLILTGTRMCARRAI